jgi:hypothetical protein
VRGIVRTSANPYRLFDTSGVLVLCAVLFAQNFLPTDLSSPFIVLLGLSIMAFGKIQRSYLKLVWPLLGVLFVGFIGVYDHEMRHILRDIAFALTPITLIAIGYWIAGKRAMWPLILKVMVNFGFILAAIHLSTFLLNPGLLSLDLEEVRKAAGVGAGSLATLSLVIGLFQYRLGIGNMFPNYLPRLIALPVLLLSFVLSYSRTEFVVMVVLTLALLGLVTRVNLRTILVAVVLVVSLFAMVVTTPEGEVGTFRSKLIRSATEVAVSNYETRKDINDNWRGFETYQVLASFSNGNIQQQILGQGFGALVDLGFYIGLGETDLRYIPIFHNGYAYVLIKTGLLGLAFYVFFYVSVIRYALRYNDSLNLEQRFLARLLFGCALSLILIMYVVGGMAQAAQPAFVLLLGYLVRRIEQLRTENSNPASGRNG